MSGRAALVRCVDDADEFLSKAFGVEPRLHVGPPFDDLLTLADVDTALTGGGLRRPAVRVVRDGEILEPSTWTRRARTGAITIDDLVDPARVLDLYAGGATIVLQSLHRWCPPIARFCRQLELDLTHAVQANAYLTPAGAAGLAPHHDTHDVFVLQLHGEKHWTVREPTVDAPLPRHRSDHEEAARQPVLFETTMRPGSCMYLPRGVVHAARAQEGSSLHLTIGILATTAYDIVRRVATLAGDVPALRRSLPAGWADEPQLAERVVKEALAELARFTERVDAADVAEQLSSRHLRSRQAFLDGQLLELDRLDSIDDDTVVDRRDGLVTTIGADANGVTVRAGDRAVTFPAAIEPALRRLLAGAPVRVADLADVLDGPSRVVLVRRLVRDGLVRVVGRRHG